jgi:hypothetical protein
MKTPEQIQYNEMKTATHNNLQAGAPLLDNSIQGLN